MESTKAKCHDRNELLQIKDKAGKNYVTCFNTHPERSRVIPKEATFNLQNVIKIVCLT